MKDLDAAQLDWVKKFHDAYYAPNNAVLSIAGDFEENEAMALVKKYFGDARSIAVPKFEAPPLPEQTAPRSAVVEDTHAKLPGLFYGWTTPPAGEPDHYALRVAGRVLADGESSRLYRQLVREKSLVIEIDAGLNGWRGPDMFEVSAKLASGAKIADVQKAIDAQIADLAKNGPTDDELKKVKTRLNASFLLGLESNIARAQKVAEFEVYRGDAKLFEQEPEKFAAVTKEDVKRVVAKYLTANRKNTIEVKPATTAAPEKK